MKLLKFEMRFPVVILALFLLSECLFANFWESKSEEELLSPIIREYGPLVDEERAPVTINFIKSILTELSAAQIKRIEEDPLINERFREVLHKVFLIDSPILDSFVLSPTEAGERISRQFIVITTGLIKEIESSAANEVEASLLLYGLVARELGRPLNQLDFSGAGQQNYVQRRFSQAAVIRGDIEGSILLNDLNFDLKAVFDVTKITDSPSEIGVGNLEQSFAGEKPHFEVRLSALRGFLTAWRFMRGNLENPQSPKPFPSKVKEELENIDTHSSIWTYQEPKTLQATINRLLAVPSFKDQYPSKYTDLEFNRLLLTLNKHLGLTSFDQLESEEQKDLLRLSRRMVLNDDYKYLPTYKPEKLFIRRFNSQHLDASKNYYQLVDENSFFKNPQYLKEIYSSFATRVEDQANVLNYDDPFLGFHSLLNSLTLLAPAEVVSELFQKEIGIFIDQLLSSEKQDYSGAHTIFPFSASSKMIVWNLLRKKAIATKDRNKLLHVYFNKSYNYQFPLLTTDAKQGLSSFELNSLEAMLEIVRSESEEAILYKQRLDFVHQHLGPYGLFELGGPKRFMWQILAESLGLPVSEVHKMVEEAVVKKLENAIEGIIEANFQFTENEEFVSFSVRDILNLISSQKNTSGISNVYADGKDYPAWLSSKICQKVMKLVQSQHLEANYLNVIQHKIVPRCQLNFPKVTFQPFREHILEKSNAWNQMSFGEILSEIEQIVQSIYGKKSRGNPHYYYYFAVALKEQDNINIDRKTAFFEKLFLKQISNDYFYINDFQIGKIFYSGISNSQKKELIEILQKYGLASNLFDYLMQLVDKFGSGANISYFSGVLVDEELGIQSRLLEEIKKSEFSKAISLYETFFTNKWEKSYSVTQDYSADVITKTKTTILETIASKVESDEEARLLFMAITKNGPFKASDIYFKNQFLEREDKETQEDMNFLISVLEEKDRILDTGTILKTFKLAFQDKQEELEESRFSAKHKFLQKFHALVEHGSLAKDEYIEDLTWELGISGIELLEFEENKGSNLRHVNPYFINAGSFIAGAIEEFTQDEIIEIIEYVVNPGDRAMPTFLAKSIEKKLRPFFIHLAGDESTSQILAAKARQEMEQNISTSSPEERVGLLQMLLSGGSAPLIYSDSKMDYIRKEILGFEPGTVDEVLLLSYFKVARELEHPSSWAYLLSQANNEHDGIASLFSLFQTPGKKLGQLVSIFNLLGEEIAEQTKSLKTMAPGLTKFQIEEILRRKGYENKFRLIKVLGAAGIKTVALVEVLETGELAVLCLQDQYAMQNTKTNLEFMREFIHQAAIDVEAAGFEPPGPFFRAVVDDLEEFLEVELDFRQEAESMRKSKKYFATAKQVNGIKVEVIVPDVRDDLLPTEKDLLLMSFAGGESWDDLKETYLELSENPLDEDKISQLELAGKAVVRNILSQFFETGFIHTDPHGENVRIDMQFEKQFARIFLIDWGQSFQTESSRLSSNSRVQTIRFLRGLAERDANLIVQAAIKMAKKDSRRKFSNGARLQLVAELETTLSTLDMHSEKSAIKVLDTIYKGGLKLKPVFAIGILKAIIYLIKESYVNETGIASEVQNSGLRYGIMERASFYNLRRAIDGIMAKFGTNKSCFDYLSKDFEWNQ